MVKLVLKEKLRLDKASQRKDNYHFDKDVPKRFLKSYKGYRIYDVDGNYIRDNIDIDFVGGGNPSRYQYVPEGEIWIERLSNSAPEDIEGFIKHEYVECEDMKNNGDTYNKAHDIASAAEKKLRNKYIP